MLDPSNWPLSGIEACVHDNRWDNADCVFKDLSKLVNSGEPGDIDACAVHSSITWEFIFGFCQRRKIYRRQAAKCVEVLLGHRAWLRAAGRSQPALQEQARRLPEEVRTALAQLLSVPPVEDEPEVAAAPIAPTPGRPPAPPAAGKAARLSVDFAAIRPDPAVSTEFHEAVRAVCEMDGPAKLANSGDEVFIRFRRACLHASQSPCHMTTDEARNAAAVLRFLAQYANKNRFRLRQVLEVLGKLREFPGWAVALATPVATQLVESELPQDVRDAFMGGLHVDEDSGSDDSSGGTHAAVGPRDPSPSSRTAGGSCVVTSSTPAVCSGAAGGTGIPPDTMPAACRLAPAPVSTGFSTGSASTACKPARAPQPQGETVRHSLPAIGGSYEWVRFAKGNRERNLRKQVAEQTLAACRSGAYTLDGERIPLPGLDAAKAATVLVSAYDGHAVPVADHGVTCAAPLWLKHAPGLVAQVAVEHALAGSRVAAVNAASAYQAGGGFLSGGRHALEESLCVQSTLFPTLEVARAKAAAAGVAAPTASLSDWGAGAPRECHIPEHGAVLSPRVEVFRGGTMDGYPLLARPVELCAVVSVAMPNCNPMVSDAPVDAPDDDQEYFATLALKFTALCKAAVHARADVLVVPDVGCGVYGNNPEDIGRVFGETVSTGFAGAFREIHLVGSDAFTAAVEAAAGAG